MRVYKGCVVRSVHLGELRVTELCYSSEALWRSVRAWDRTARCRAVPSSAAPAGRAPGCGDTPGVRQGTPVTLDTPAVQTERTCVLLLTQLLTDDSLLPPHSSRYLPVDTDTRSDSRYNFDSTLAGAKSIEQALEALEALEALLYVNIVYYSGCVAHFTNYINPTQTKSCKHNPT